VELFAGCQSVSFALAKKGLHGVALTRSEC